MYQPIVLAPFTDLLVWYLGIYGLSWSLIFSFPISPLKKYIFNKEITSDYFIWKFLSKLITCIVCTSFWCATLLVSFYFKSEILLTKILIVFSTVATTWFTANKFGDYE
jgi:hypothetical protein